MKPKYIIVAGTNGAGKSTLYLSNSSMFENTIRINADEILRKNKGNWQNDKDNAKAMKQVVKLMDKAFEEKQSFHQETTLAGRGHNKWINKAKKNGYEISLFYVALPNAELAINRVNERVKKGGHGVLQETIIKRYERSLNNLKEVAKVCDNVMIYDNSKNLELIYKRTGNEIKVNRLWEYSYLNKLFFRGKEINNSNFSIENVKTQDKTIRQNLSKDKSTKKLDQER